MPRLTVARLTTAAGAALAALRLLLPASFEVFDLKVVDLRHLVRGPIAPGDEVVIVGIDEQSLATLGRWPWPRTRVAELVDAIGAAKPAAVGMDVVFDHRDDALDAARIRQAVASAPRRPASELIAEVDGIGDRELVRALREAGPIGLAYFFEFDHDIDPAAAAEMAGLPELSVRSVSGADIRTAKFLLEGRRVHRPLPPLAAAAGDGGHINFLPDDDGLFRRVPLVVRVGDRAYPSLGLQLVRRYLGGVPATVELSPFEVRRLTLGTRALPVNAMGQLTINYLGPTRTVPHLSAADVLTGRAPAERLRGRIVVVGFTAAGFDDVSTPFSPVGPGVELQATLIDNLLHDRALWRPWWAVPMEAMTIVLAGLIVGAMGTRLRGAGGGVAALLIVAVYLAVSQALFSNAGLVVGAVHPVLGTFGCALAAVAFQATRSEREKRRIRDAFSLYLNPEVTELVADDPRQLRLGGERSEISVLFSDIRGFSTISEQLEPEVLGEFLNEYLTAMTDVVFRHDGLLDKYVGDAVMAFWGAPIAVPDHAARSCRAALDMLGEVQRLNERWTARGLPAIRIGIGIHTGPASVGNFGSERRFSYTAVGDTVNLASRLEGLNKTYGTQLLVSEDTRREMGPGFACRGVGEVTVRGRVGSTGVYELTGHAS